MILKSIEIQGFKSFADKIYLDFNSGITAIVGPNGSGKSNIADAIRWVMGEQSIKSLRGNRMEDVIFSGTESRKALGFAEVAINLDNESGVFGTEFREIRVSRRLYRSGESEYYINKANCRLKDVHELFMDTGLGRDGYSIIGQGQIDNILSTKSEDRRHIFEEASGISKYKYRKTEAERKLEKTAENITRIEDILGELSTRLEPLRIQSEKAKEYLVLRDEMKDLEINLSIIDIEKKREDLKKLEENIKIYDNQMRAIKAEISESDRKVEALYEEIAALDGKTDACRQKQDALKELSHEIANRISLAKNEISHFESSIERLKEENAESDNKAADLDEKITELNNGLKNLNSQREALKISEDKLAEKTRKADSDISERSAALEKLRSDAVEKASELNGCKSRISSLDILRENFETRKKTIQSELENKDTSAFEINQKLSNLKSSIEDCTEYIEELKRETNKTDEAYGAKNAEMQDRINRKNRDAISLSEHKSAIKMLENMERDFEGYSRGVKGVMNAFKKGIFRAGIHGPLSQLIKTDKKYITAIETAMGSAAQNIVTDTAEDAKNAIKYLKDNRLGRATFLPISEIRGRKIDTSVAEKLAGYIGTAAELVKCDSIYSETVENILGTTAVADTIDNAIAMGRKCGHRFRIVTLGGDVVQAGGAMTGGSAPKTSGSLSRANEIDELKAKVKETEKKIVDHTKHINRLSMEAADLLEEIKNNNNRLSEKNEEAVRLKSEYEHLEALMASTDADREKMASELEDLKTQTDKITAEIEQTENTAQKLESEIEELNKVITERGSDFDRVSGENERLNRELLDLTIKRNSVMKDIEQTNDKIRIANDEKSALISSKVSRLDEIRNYESRILDYQDKIKEYEKETEENKAASEDLEAEIANLIKKRKDTEQNVKTSQDSVKDVRDSLLKLTNLHAKAQSGYENTDAELEEIIDHLWEEYELTYTDAKEDRRLDDFDKTAAAKRIGELRRKIKNLGNINIDAIEEYKDVKERTDFLTEQIDDLNKSKRELNGIITEMTAVMKQRFSEQFAKINQSFNSVFSELFGGGRAKLSLSDPDNVLESGIDIEAQPPGKKLQSLMLLSGGEKALSAIALLFAILKVRPTPFCVLDEVEAALDDVNVYRFAAYLKQYSKNTQFVVVTHKRGTMEAANMLYGVTMQEKGVSKLLSLNIDEVSQ